MSKSSTRAGVSEPVDTITVADNDRGFGKISIVKGVLFVLVRIKSWVRNTVSALNPPESFVRDAIGFNPYPGIKTDVVVTAPLSSVIIYAESDALYIRIR